jgi:L-fucose mutarotase
MLKNLPPQLSADLLYHLCAMGHGDEVAIVDANFPAHSNAQRHVALPGNQATEVLDAVMSVLPLDSFVEHPANHMQVVGDPQAVPEICHEFSSILNRHQGEDVNLGSIERFDFYKRVKQCYLVVSTSEARLYGNIIITKGIIAPD